MAPVTALILKHHARKWNLPFELVIAVARVESSGNSWAFRVEPAYRFLWDVRRERPFECSAEQAASRTPPPTFEAPAGITAASEWIAQQTSWGLMQIIGATARQMGFQGLLPSLCDPNQGADIGCKYLAWLRDRHLRTHGWMGVLDAYNDGTTRIEHAHDYPHRVADAGAPFVLESTGAAT